MVMGSTIAAKCKMLEPTANLHAAPAAPVKAGWRLCSLPMQDPTAGRSRVTVRVHTELRLSWSLPTHHRLAVLEMKKALAVI
mmetsp:Transcript_24598/g.67596  ORF Transcript_24598/g.67596 Transcript_24598/m.67596 type:complete len:82 (-) Transcript_24598:1122-1367(-)